MLKCTNTSEIDSVDDIVFKFRHLISSGKVSCRHYISISLLFCKQRRTLEKYTNHAISQNSWSKNLLSSKDVLSSLKTFGGHWCRCGGLTWRFKTLYYFKVFMFSTFKKQFTVCPRSHDIFLFTYLCTI